MTARPDSALLQQPNCLDACIQAHLWVERAAALATLDEASRVLVGQDSRGDEVSGDVSDGHSRRRRQ